MPVFADVPAPTIGGHDEAKFRRGRGEPDGRIDLHGMTQEEAYRALIRFLMNAQADGKRLILVITGKGGILRAQSGNRGEREKREAMTDETRCHAKGGKWRRGRRISREQKGERKACGL